MTLQDWQHRHTAFNKDRTMKTVKVKILLNIGTDDKWIEPYQAGDTPDVEEAVAHRLYRLGWAEEYDAKKEAEREEASREDAIRAAMPAAAAKVAKEEVEREAEQRLKNPESAKAKVVKSDAAAPVTAETAKEFASDPHNPKKAGGK